MRSFHLRWNTVRNDSEEMQKQTFYPTKRKCFILHYPLPAPCTGGGPAQREFSPALILLFRFSFLGQRWEVWDPNRSIKDGFMLPTTTTTALIFRPSAQLNVQTHKCIYPFPSDNPLHLNNHGQIQTKANYFSSSHWRKSAPCRAWIDLSMLLLHLFQLLLGYKVTQYINPDQCG